MRIIQAIVLLSVCIACSYAKTVYSYTELTVALNKMVDERATSFEIRHKASWAPLLNKSIPEDAKTAIKEFVNNIDADQIPERLTSDQIVPFLTAVFDAFYEVEAFDDLLRLVPSTVRRKAWNKLLGQSKPETLRKAKKAVASLLVKIVSQNVLDVQFIAIESGLWELDNNLNDLIPHRYTTTLRQLPSVDANSGAS